MAVEFDASVVRMVFQSVDGEVHVDEVLDAFSAEQVIVIENGEVHKLEAKSSQDRMSARKYRTDCVYTIMLVPMKPACSFNDSEVRVLEEAYRRKYIDKEGNLAKLLARFDEITKLGDSYSFTTSVIQASGMGKTRSLTELSSLGVYVCYCSFQRGGGYPFRTTDLANSIMGITTDGHAGGLLKAWLVYLKRWVEENGKDPVKWTNDQLFLSLNHESQVISGVLKEWRSSPATDMCGLQNAFTNIEGVIRKGGVGVLLVFDEARVLFKQAHATRTSVPAHHLRRVFRTRGLYGALGVFVDTLPSQAILGSAPSQLQVSDPSYRVSLGIGQLPDPIWKLYTMDSVSKPLDDLQPDDKNIFLFGRPLWAGYLTKDKIYALNFAETKLAGGITGYDISQGKVSSTAAIAILGLRIGVVPNPCSKLAVDLAAAYCYPILHISDDRESVFVTEPWDPILAEAAIRFWEYPEFRKSALTSLLKSLNSFDIDQGKSIEMVTKYIVMRAIDSAGENTLGSLVNVLLGDSVCEWLGSTGLARARVNAKSFVTLNYVPSSTELLRLYKLGKAVHFYEHGCHLLVILLLPDETGQYVMDEGNISVLYVHDTCCHVYEDAKVKVAMDLHSDIELKRVFSKEQVLELAIDGLGQELFPFLREEEVLLLKEIQQSRMLPCEDLGFVQHVLPFQYRPIKKMKHRHEE